VGQSVCKDFLKMINGSLDMESLAAGNNSAPAAQDGAAPGVDQEKYNRLAKELEAVREIKESLEVKLQETENKYQEVRELSLLSVSLQILADPLAR